VTAGSIGKEGRSEKRGSGTFGRVFAAFASARGAGDCGGGSWFASANEAFVRVRGSVESVNEAFARAREAAEEATGPGPLAAEQRTADRGHGGGVLGGAAVAMLVLPPFCKEKRPPGGSLFCFYSIYSEYQIDA
jgi:hypothetical protein